jgi:hypothetical protein
MTHILAALRGLLDYYGPHPDVDNGLDELLTAARAALDEQAADVRLMAAAPDLLNALIAAEKEMAYYSSTRRSDQLPSIRAAIAKATL